MTRTQAFLILGACTIVLALIAAAGYQYAYKGIDARDIRAKALAENLDQSLESNDIERALSAYLDTVGSRTLSVREKSSSLLIGSGLPFRVSGDPADAIKAIRALKELAADSSVQPIIRANAVMEVAYWYQKSGYNWEIFNEIFSGDYSQNLRKSGEGINATASIGSLLRRSYAITPTYQAAIGIADSDVVLLYHDEAYKYTPNMQFLKDDAQKYLAIAEDLMANGKNQIRSTEAQRDYEIEHAFVIGGLAHFVGTPYTTQYKDAFERLFGSLSTPPGGDPPALLALAHYWYAAFLLQVDKNKVGAAAELEAAIEAAEKDSHFDTNPLVARIRTKKSGNVLYEAPVTLDQMTAISSEFKAFVDGIK